MRFDDYISNSVQLALDLATLALDHDLETFHARQREMFVDHDFAADPTGIGATDSRALLRIGGQLAMVLDTDDDEQFLDALADLLDAQRARPVLTRHDGRPHLHYTRDGATMPQWMAAIAVAGLVVHVCAHGRARLRRCIAQGCGRWFGDESRNSSRRYCSGACASRTTVGAFRSRLRIVSDPGGRPGRQPSRRPGAGPGSGR